MKRLWSINQKRDMNREKYTNQRKIIYITRYPITGCNRKILLSLYQALIRSILDYGVPIYGLAPHPQLTLLETIQNSAIPICTGAFYTSAALNLCAESGLPPLHYRRLTLTGGLLSSIAQLPFTSIHEYLFSKTCTKPILNRAHAHMWCLLNHSLSHIIKFNCLTPIYPSIPPCTLPPSRHNS